MIKNNLDNFHQPVLLDKIIKFIPKDKKINVIDATFGGGGYSRLILEKFKVNKLLAIDRDPISKFFSLDLEKKYPKKFKLINDVFSKIDKYAELENLKEKKSIKFDLIIFDLGLSSNQIEDPDRGFSFLKNGPLNMNMGKSKILASELINKFSEKDLADIIFEYGEERHARAIARNIVKARKVKIIKNTKELSDLINNFFSKKKLGYKKINYATKTFQALRIYVNDELNELTSALNKSQNILEKKGKLIIVSFQSLEDRIVKDFLNHKSGKRWRSSRHYPEQAEEGPITLKIITKKPIRPEESEVKKNPRSRSAKLRIGEKISWFMKYYTTIIGLFSFSIIAVLLNLYFGNLSNKTEKEINKLKIKMIELEDQIKINEIEFAYHTNLKYLTKLDRIYNIEKSKTQTGLQLIDLNKLDKNMMIDIIKVSNN